MSPKKLGRPRPFHHLRAFLMGYFWLPCPICGKKFAGYEAGDASVPLGDGSYLIACKEHNASKEMTQ